MRSAFDDPETTVPPSPEGVYLAPHLQQHYRSDLGGTLVVISSCSRGIEDAIIEQYRQSTYLPKIGQPVLLRVRPVYADDAARSKNPSFALAALREFIEICMECHPDFQAPRDQQRTLQ